MNNASAVPKTRATSLAADPIAGKYFGGGESAYFHCFDTRFDSEVKI